eukprot:gene880-3475_t
MSKFVMGALLHALLGCSSHGGGALAYNTACEVSPIRSGSTLIYNVLMKMLVDPKIAYNKMPLDGQPLNMTWLEGQSREYCQWGGVGMLQIPVELPPNVLLLRYEDFVDDTMFAIKKIATFFDLAEDLPKWAKIDAATSRAVVEQKISKLTKFSQMDSKTQYHGNHISSYEGHTNYKDLLTQEQIDFILSSTSPILKKGKPTGRYIGEVMAEVIARYGYTA